MVGMFTEVASMLNIGRNGKINTQPALGAVILLFWIGKW